MRFLLLLTLAILQNSSTLALSPNPLLVFPGGGINFYHVAGQLRYIQQTSSTRYRPLSEFDKIGGSAGALAATLCHNNVGTSLITSLAIAFTRYRYRFQLFELLANNYHVDYYEATNYAINQVKRVGLWGGEADEVNNKFGLAGIWGEMVREWLDALLPDDAHERSSSKCELLVTPFGLPITKQVVSTFSTKAELINANLASVHIPFFLDGKVARNLNGELYVDGSFLLEGTAAFRSLSEKRPEACVTFDYKDDVAFYGEEVSERSEGGSECLRSSSLRSSKLSVQLTARSLQGRGRLDFIKLMGESRVWEMLRRGEEFAKERERRGDFKLLEQ